VTALPSTDAMLPPLAAIGEFEGVHRSRQMETVDPVVPLRDRPRLQWRATALLSLNASDDFAMIARHVTGHGSVNVH
jgi:hypothetical protein